MKKSEKIANSYKNKIIIAIRYLKERGIYSKWKYNVIRYAIEEDLTLTESLEYIFRDSLNKNFPLPINVLSSAFEFYNTKEGGSFWFNEDGKYINFLENFIYEQSKNN